jgi:hypothetical protein
MIARNVLGRLVLRAEHFEELVAGSPFVIAAGPHGHKINRCGVTSGLDHAARLIIINVNTQRAAKAAC